MDIEGTSLALEAVRSELDISQCPKILTVVSLFLPHHKN